MEREIRYAEAIEEIEVIAAEIEDPDIDIDLLSEKVKRALYLIKFCKLRLKNTEEELTKILTGFEEGDIEKYGR